VILAYDDEKGQAVFDKNAKRVREPPLVYVDLYVDSMFC
jgi:hypothetical protein